MLNLLISLLVVFPTLVIYSIYGCASPTPGSYQNTPQVRVHAIDQLAQGYGDRGDRMARQVCIATLPCCLYRYMGRSLLYSADYDDVRPRREEACAKAIGRCLKHRPGAPCQCIPDRADRGGSCEELEYK